MTQVFPSTPSTASSTSTVTIPKHLASLKRVNHRRNGLRLTKATQYASRISMRFVAPPPCTMKIMCSPGIFRFLWIVIVSLQLIVSVALMRAVYSNVWTLVDNEEIVEALRHFGIEYSAPVMAGTATVTIVSAYVNLTDVVRYIRCSFHHRQLMFEDLGAHRHDHIHSFHVAALTWIRTRCEKLGAPIVKVWRACGVHGAFFDIGMYVREFFEIVLQTYQTYRVSYYVSEPWVNNFAVSLVVINCWTTPLVDLLFTHNEPLRRALCLAADLLLDTLSGLALPMLVFASYRGKQETLDWYDPLWIMDAGNDLIYFHINTWLDLMSRTMPSVSLIHCLHSITLMLVRRPEVVTVSKLAPSPSSNLVPVVPQPRQNPLRSVHLSKTMTMTHRPKANFVHKVMFLFGAIILSVGVLAQHGPQLSPVLPGCQKTMRPWLIATERFPCAVLELNCAKYPKLDDHNGSAFNTLLDQADRSALVALIIVHCPRVHMPSKLAVFRNLVWLEVYNSTINDWPVTAALTQQHHSIMSTALFVRVNVIAIVTPTNVLMERLVTGSELPISLQRVAIAATNLSMMAPVNQTVQRRPRSLQKLLLEDCDLSTMPLFSPSVRTDVLSLTHNPFSDVNSLHSALLPTRLQAHVTRIQTCINLPSTTMTIFASESPICAAAAPLEKHLTCGSATVDCTNQTHDIPLALIDARHNVTKP